MMLKTASLAGQYDEEEINQGILTIYPYKYKGKVCNITINISTEPMHFCIYCKTTGELLSYGDFEKPTKTLNDPYNMLSAHNLLAGETKDGEALFGTYSKLYIAYHDVQ